MCVGGGGKTAEQDVHSHCQVNQVMIMKNIAQGYHAKYSIEVKAGFLEGCTFYIYTAIKSGLYST